MVREKEKVCKVGRYHHKSYKSYKTISKQSIKICLADLAKQM
jgi:hypothetical protein